MRLTYNIYQIEKYIVLLPTVHQILNRILMADIHSHCAYFMILYE